MERQLKITTLAAALALGACAVDDPHLRTKTGAAVGAVAGAVLGHQLDDKSGRYVGAAVGALAGGAVGNYMDRQQQALNQALERERALGLQVQQLQDGTIKLDIPSEISFDFDSAEIKPAFRPSLNNVADVLRQYDRTVVHIIGHTDSTGPDAYNQQLSQRRASATATYLANQGVSMDRLRTEGRGESQPRASNATEVGRAQNRRVEIFIKPIVEGQEQRAYQTPVAGYGGGY